jgi:hypothetical protein
MIYKRIEIGPPIGPRVDQRDVVEAPSSYSPSECDRIWKLVKQTAQGTCAPIVSEGKPEDWKDCDTSGWEAA